MNHRALDRVLSERTAFLACRLPVQLALRPGSSCPLPELQLSWSALMLPQADRCRTPSQVPDIDGDFLDTRVREEFLATSRLYFLSRPN